MVTTTTKMTMSYPIVQHWRSCGRLRKNAALLYFSVVVMVTGCHVSAEVTRQLRRQGCSRTFRSSDHSKVGYFHLPSYPEPYSSPLNCVFVFLGSDVERVVISFIAVNLEYSNGDPGDPSNCSGMDTISIESPSSSSSSLTSSRATKSRGLIGVYCGSKLPPRTMSSHGVMKVTFSTGTVVNTFGNGFFAKFEFVRDLGIKSGLQDFSYDCRFFYHTRHQDGHPSTTPKRRPRSDPPPHEGSPRRGRQFLQNPKNLFNQDDRTEVDDCHLIDEDDDKEEEDDEEEGDGAACKGVFHSPNYPGLYPKNTTCEYVFQVGPRQSLEITFVHFDVEGLPPVCSESTKSDYLEINQAEPHDQPSVHSSAKRHSKLQPSVGQPEMSHGRPPSSSSSRADGKRVDCKNEDVFRIFYGLKLAGNSKIRNTGHVTDDIVRMTSDGEDSHDRDLHINDDDDEDDNDDDIGGDDDDGDGRAGGPDINYENYDNRENHSELFLSEPLFIGGHNDDDDVDDDDYDDDDDDDDDYYYNYNNAHGNGYESHDRGDETVRDGADNDTFDGGNDSDGYSYLADGPPGVKVIKDNVVMTANGTWNDDDDDADVIDKVGDDDDNGGDDRHGVDDDDDDESSDGNLQDSKREAEAGNDEKSRNSGENVENNGHDPPSLSARPDNDHLRRSHHHHHQARLDLNHHHRHRKHHQRRRHSEPVPTTEPSKQSLPSILTSYPDGYTNSTRPANRTTLIPVAKPVAASSRPIRWRAKAPPPTRPTNQKRVVAFHRFGLPRSLQNPMRLCGSKADLRQLTFAFSGPHVTFTFSSNDMYDAMGFKCRYRFLPRTRMQISTSSERVTLSLTQLQKWVIAVVIFTNLL